VLDEWRRSREQREALVAYFLAIDELPEMAPQPSLFSDAPEQQPYSNGDNATPEQPVEESNDAIYP